MKLLLLAILPAFIAGCSCGDNPSVSAPHGPQGGVTPMRQEATNDNPPLSIWTSLDPSTCNSDVTSPELKPPIFVSPVINPLGGRSFAVLLWSFCNPGRNALPAQAPYNLLVSPTNLVTQKSQNDANCRGSRPRPDRVSHGVLPAGAHRRPFAHHRAPGTAELHMPR